MKLSHSNDSIATNAQNAVQFGISKNSAKLFSMLSTSLYSNKERAVLFEIGANCVDAHSLNGNESKQWDLILPTQIDPHIHFRDYGPGLSEEQVYNLLTTYGESTKSDSNEFIGAYGIGSKSPAAVSSTWNVISRHDGMLKEYIVFIDRSGIPSLTKLREEKTTDNGLEVIIPIQMNRISNWLDNIVEVYKHYSIKPNVVNGNGRYKWANKAKLASGDGWSVVDSGNYYSTISFITTQREYPVDSATLKTEFKGEQFLKLLELGVTMNIEFPVGELDTSLSRENIQYTHHSMNSVKNRLTAVYAALKKAAEDALSAAKDGLEYREMVVKASTTLFGNDRNNQRAILQLIHGNKYGVSSVNDLNNFNIDVPLGIFSEFKVFDGTKRYMALKPGFTCWKKWAIGYDEQYGGSKGTLNIRIGYLDKIKIVIDDGHQTMAKIKHNLKGNLVLMAPSAKVFPKEFDRLIIKGSTLPKAPRKTREERAKAKKEEFELWSLYRNSFVKVPDVSKLNTKDYRANVVFQFTDARQQSSILDDDKKVLDLMRRDYSNLLHDVKILAMKVGKNMPKWCVTPAEFLQNEIKRLNTKDFVEGNAHIGAKNAIENSYDTAIRLVRKTKIRTEKPSVWNEVADMISIELSRKVAVKDANSTQFEYLKAICELAGVTLTVANVEVTSLDKISKKLYSSYKMLKFIDGYNKVDQADLLEYLTQVGV